MQGWAGTWEARAGGGRCATRGEVLHGSLRAGSGGHCAVGGGELRRAWARARRTALAGGGLAGVARPGRMAGCLNQRRSSAGLSSVHLSCTGTCRGHRVQILGPACWRGDCAVGCRLAWRWLRQQMELQLAQTLDGEASQRSISNSLESGAWAYGRKGAPHVECVSHHVPLPPESLVRPSQIRFTALHGALNHAQHEVAILLLERGANPQVCTCIRSNVRGHCGQARGAHCRLRRHPGA